LGAEAGQARDLRDDCARLAAEASQLKAGRARLAAEVAQLNEALLERKHEAASRSADLTVQRTLLVAEFSTAVAWQGLLFKNHYSLRAQYRA